MKIRSATDCTLASVEDLREFLKVENVPFTDGALKPELVALARGYIAERNAKNNPIPPPADEGEAIESADDALRHLNAKGFKDVAEVKAYIAVIHRDIAELERRKGELVTAQEDLARRDFEMKGREEAVVRQAAEVRADIAKQTELYEKLERMRTQMRQEGSLATANP